MLYIILTKDLTYLNSFVEIRFESINELVKTDLAESVKIDLVESGKTD